MTLPQAFPASLAKPTRQTFGPGYNEVVIPSGRREVDITILGAGGGGGSGARRATGGVRTGGGSGYGGNTHKLRLAVSDLGAPGTILPIFVGTGGLGGAAVANDNTNGNNGAQGSLCGIGTMLYPNQTVSPTPNAINSVAQNGTIMVAVGAAGTIYSTTDGATWSARTSGTANALNSIAWSAALGLFVAVGAAGTIVTSPDGITWTVQTSGTANALNSVIAGGAGFVAVGAVGTIVTSTNGTTWVVNAHTSAATLNEVAYNGTSLYIAVDSTGNTVSASNPTGTWTDVLVMPFATQGINGIAYGAGIWVMNVALNGNLYTSPDGTTWTNRGPKFQRFNPMTYVVGSIPNDRGGGMTGMFIMERDYSFDGLTWYRIAHSGGGGAARISTIFKGFLYAATGFAGTFVGQMSRIVTAFTPIHVMATFGGTGGSTSAAASGSSDGSASLPGATGSASVVTGAPAGIPNAVGAGGGGAGGGATAANAIIAAGIGAEGSIAPHYTLQGFQGVSGSVGPNPGGSAGTDPILTGGSGGGGGAWTSGAVGQNGADGGTPGGGGGGGGASDNGFASGAGGKGGDGQIRLLWV